MAHFIKTATLLCILLSCLSCSNPESSSHNRDNEERQQTLPSEKRKVEIVYSSPLALSVPSYTIEFKGNGPLGIIDFRTPILTVTDLCEASAWPENGKRHYTIWFHNATEDTIKVKALHLPDDRFEAKWEGRSDYIPGLSCGFRLSADSVEYIGDYRIVLTYLNDEYPPQPFHINLHSGIIKQEIPGGD